MKPLLARAAFALLSAGLLLGCPGPTLVVQQYAGPVQPREAVAILRLNGSDAVRLQMLDDDDVAVPIAPDSRLHIEMLPGRHRVTAWRAGDRYGRALVLPFDAEAGRVYRVVLGAVDPDRGDFTAQLMEVDRDSDAPLRDVTVKEAPRGPASMRRGSVDAGATPPIMSPTTVDAGAPSPSQCTATEPLDGGAPCEAGAPRL